LQTSRSPYTTVREKGEIKGDGVANSHFYWRFYSLENLWGGPRRAGLGCASFRVRMGGSGNFRKVVALEFFLIELGFNGTFSTVRLYRALKI